MRRDGPEQPSQFELMTRARRSDIYLEHFGLHRSFRWVKIGQIAKMTGTTSPLYSRRELAADSSRNILFYGFRLGGIVLSERDAARRLLEFLRRTFPCC